MQFFRHINNFRGEAEEPDDSSDEVFYTVLCSSSFDNEIPIIYISSVQHLKSFFLFMNHFRMTTQIGILWKR